MASIQLQSYRTSNTDFLIINHQRDKHNFFFKDSKYFFSLFPEASISIA